MGYLLVNSLLQNQEGAKFISNPMSTQFTVQKSFMTELQHYLQEYANHLAAQSQPMSRHNSLPTSKDSSLVDLINHSCNKNSEYLKYLLKPMFSRKMVRSVSQYLVG